MTDIHTTVAALQSLCGDVRQTRPHVMEAMSSLDRALSSLRGLAGPHARNAEADVRTAMADLQEAHATWMEKYARGADDLSHRLSA